MTCPMCKSAASLKDDFETAKVDISPEIVERVMKGLPVPGFDWSPKGIILRRAWSKHHERLRLN